MTNVLIAIAAGCASALMFASIISGVLFSLILAQLSPLPLMVAALGWGPVSALIGGVTAGLILAITFNFMAGVGFLLTVATPAFWLGHLSLLAQPAGSLPARNAHDVPLEWYPIGRIVLWAAALAALIMIFFLLLHATSSEGIMTSLREQVLQSLDTFVRAGVQIENKERMAAFIAHALPPAAVGMTTLMYLLNLWLAGRIARTSRRLRRPWPDLHATELPLAAIVVLAAALAFSFAGGLVALIAQIVAASLATAYMLVGFAVLHTFTRPSSGRLWWRLSAYAAILLFIWPLLLMPVVGLFDASFGLRRRFGGGPTPPPLPPFST